MSDESRLNASHEHSLLSTGYPLGSCQVCNRSYNVMRVTFSARARGAARWSFDLCPTCEPSDVWVDREQYSRCEKTVPFKRVETYKSGGIRVVLFHRHSSFVMESMLTHNSYMNRNLPIPKEMQAPTILYTGVARKAHEFIEALFVMMGMAL